MAFISGVVLSMILQIGASQPCQHGECQADRSVLLQQAIKKHEHTTSGQEVKSNLTGPASLRLGGYGCENWKSASMGDSTWSDSPASCEHRCANTHGCVGFQYLTATQTICKGPSQSYGHCQLWKHTCIKKADPACYVWEQYTMYSHGGHHGGGHGGGGCTQLGKDMWATGTKRSCCSGQECNVDGKLICMHGSCPGHGGCTQPGQDMWATGTKRSCCSGQECNVDGKLICMHGSCPGHGGCTQPGQDMWATGTKRSCCSGQECNVDGKLICMHGSCPGHGGPTHAPSPPPAMVEAWDKQIWCDGGRSPKHVGNAGRYCSRYSCDEKHYMECCYPKKALPKAAECWAHGCRYHCA